MRTLVLRHSTADLWAAALPVSSAVVSRLSTFVVLIVAARLLPPEQFGMFATLTVVGGIVTALVSGGGDMWLNRFTSRFHSHAHAAPALWRPYLLICGAIAAAVVLIGAAALAIAAPPPTIRNPAVIMLFGAVAVGLAEAGFAILRARGHVTIFFAVRDLLLPIAFLAGIVVLRPDAATGVLAIHAVCWGTAAAAVLLAVVGHSRPQSTNAISSRSRRRLLTHTLGLQAGNLSHRLSAQIDVLVLTWFVSLSVLGEYRIAAQFAVGFAVVQHFVFLGLPWQMRQGLHTGLAQVVNRQRLLLALSGVALAVGWLAAEPFLAYIAPRFADSAWLFRLLLLIRFTELLWGPQHEVLVSNGLPHRDAAANVVAIIAWAIAFAILSVLVVPLAAAVGATTVAATMGQWSRHQALRQADLAPVFGQPLGIALPLATSLATLVAVLVILTP